MSLSALVSTASDKTNFIGLDDYVDFCRRYLEFVVDGLQAVIVSQNETHYRFYQYQQDGHYNITRPINSHLMYFSALICGICFLSQAFRWKLQRL